MKISSHVALLAQLALTVSASPVQEQRKRQDTPTTSSLFPVYTSNGLLADAVCGTSGNLQASPALTSRNENNWLGHGMGDWFINAVKPYEANGWKFEDGTPIKDIQSLALHLAGNEGGNECGWITGPGCDGIGYDYNLCRQYPEGHFVLFSIDNWANLLGNVHVQLSDTTISLSSLTSDLVKQFFTPQVDPGNLILPVSIFSGAATLLGQLWAPASIISGVGTIVSGALTQAGLNQPDPLVQWGQVQAAIGSLYTQLTDALESFYQTTLLTIPPSTGTPYEQNSSLLPQILSLGFYASQNVVTDVPILTQTAVYSVFAASGINTLWAQDLVFIIKISDATYGKGPGAACQAFPAMTVCRDGVAYIFARWQVTGASATEWDITESHLDERNWNVWGAYAQGSADGTDNKDQLAQYNWDLDSILTSVQKTLAINDTYPFTNQNGAAIDTLKGNVGNFGDKSTLAFWSLPLCDIDSILGSGRHLNPAEDESGDDPIIRWGSCTCVQQAKWRADLYSDDSGYGDSDCQSLGWGNI